MYASFSNFVISIIKQMHLFLLSIYCVLQSIQGLAMVLIDVKTIIVQINEIYLRMMCDLFYTKRIKQQ